MPQVPASQRPAPATGVLRRLFPLPPSREDAARAWLDESTGPRAPRKPRDASAVLLVRDSPAGVQTWLGQRSVRSPLGSVSSAGGSVTGSDEAAPMWFGPTPTEWAKRLGMSDFVEAKRRVVAAIRELFEATGVLLAGPDALSLVEDGAVDEMMNARRLLAAGDLSLAQFLDRRGWGVRSDLLKPVGRWLSADFELFRFDTWYFAAAVPTGQQATPLENEAGVSTWGRWVGVNEPAARTDSTELGEEIGRPETMGATLAGLTTPATQVFLSKLKRTRGCVAYLSSNRPLGSYQPELVTQDAGESLWLDVTTVEAEEGGGVAKAR
jgi:8-oxo-dGTP pyrophosphatase MutT (NUDIX family)